MANQSKPKKRPRNVYGFEQQWAEIEDAQLAADYTTLSEFMIDSALSGQLNILADVAHCLGHLGLICNEVLISDGDGKPPRLEGLDAKIAVDRIIDACDAVTDLLRKA